MKITSITAGWSETISLGNYNNVKPSLTLTAALEESEIPFSLEIQADLIARCRSAVRHEIDETLELHGQPMLYYTGPLYQVVASSRHRLVAILDYRIRRPDGFCFVADTNRSSARAIRLERAQRLAADAAAGAGYRLFDCTNPELPADIQVVLAEIEAAWEQIQSAVAEDNPDPEGLADHGDYEDDDDPHDDDEDNEDDPDF